MQKSFEMINKKKTRQLMIISFLINFSYLITKNKSQNEIYKNFETRYLFKNS